MILYTHLYVHIKMQVKEKELIIFIIIVAVIIALISNENRKLSLLVVLSGIAGNLIAGVFNDAYLRNWLFVTPPPAPSTPI